MHTIIGADLYTNKGFNDMDFKYIDFNIVLDPLFS